MAGVLHAPGNILLPASAGTLLGLGVGTGAPAEGSLLSSHLCFLSQQASTFSNSQLFL